MTSLGEKIKSARVRKKLTQRELGTMMGFGHPPESIICKWESDEREMKISNLRKLANALGVRVGTLLSEAK